MAYPIDPETFSSTVPVEYKGKRYSASVSGEVIDSIFGGDLDGNVAEVEKVARRKIEAGEVIGNTVVINTSDF